MPPPLTPRQAGTKALEHLNRTPERIAALIRWSVIDELTMAELQNLERDLFALQERLQAVHRQLIDGYKKRVAQSVGSELRHEAEALRKELADCQAAKLALADLGEGP